MTKEEREAQGTTKTYTSVESFSIKGVGDFYNYKNSANGQEYMTRISPENVAIMVQAVENGTASKNQDVFVHNMAYYLS